VPPVIYRIADITSADELIRYAVRAQLALVEHEASQNVVAMAIGMGRTPKDAGPNLISDLRDGTISDVKLQRLDEVIVALAPNLMHAGGLSSLAITLRGYRNRESLSDRIPASWAREILQTPAENEVGVLTQASALLSAFLAADRLEQARHTNLVLEVHNRYHDEIKRVVDQLIILGYAPPTGRSVEALIMLGTLGSYAFDIIKPVLEDALKHPLGFRLWRAITKLVQLSKPGNRYRPSLQPWVLGQLRRADMLRTKSAYPGRSLDLELAVAVPPDWTSAQDDPIGAALRARANNPSATVRERGAAALGLWQRAMENTELDRDRVRSDLENLIAEFEDPERRPDAYQGMQWAAALLRHVMARNVPVCNDWPQGIDEPWLQHFGEAARHLREHDIPPQILPATETLFQHAILQGADAYRRQAIETLLAGGWTAPVVSALGKFLELENSGAWIRIRALFGLGFLQHRDRVVEGLLAEGCHAAYRNLSGKPSQAQIHEMHAVLFAIGDCYGATGVAHDEVRRVRDSIQDVLTGLVDGKLTFEPALFAVSRAAAYLLTFMILPRENNKVDLAEELLEKLRKHPDSVTQELSEWALKNRLGGNGEVPPLTMAKP
jgi:hypothetical protein